MFQVIRRHQKTMMKWFAGLTILSMVGFAFGPSLLRDREGDQRASDSVVEETIFDHKVTKRDLQRTRDERFVANSFVREILIAVDPRARFLLDNFEFFGSVRNDEEIKDAIRQAYKAEALGITVSDEMVKAWITKITDGKLTTQQFRAVVQKLGREISQDTLFDILRRQLEIQRVQELAFGRFGSTASLVTPYEAWQFYRKLNDKVALELIPVAVAEFTDQVPEPSDDELRKLYDQYVDRLPDPTSPDPGFKEPHKLQLQYAFGSVEPFALALKPQVTEDEIQEYYDSHKDRYRVFLTSSDKDSTPSDTKPDETPEASEKTKDELPKPEDTEKPTAPTIEDEDELENPPQASDQSGDAAEQRPPIRQPEAKTDPEPPATEPANEQTGEHDDKDTSNTDAGKGQKEAESSGTKKDEAPRYKPLEEVADEIRDSLARNKARDEVVSRLEQVKEKVFRFTEVYLEAEIAFEEAKAMKPGLKFQPPDDSEFSTELQQQLKELDLNHSQTELLSIDDLAKLAVIGTSTEGWGDPSLDQSAAQVLRDAKMYDPRELKNFNENYVLAWKTADQPEHEPPFNQIRDRVMAAYRTIRAREFAKKRAEALAQSVRESGGDMAKVYEGNPGVETSSIPPLSLWSSAPQFSPSRPFSPGEVVPTELPNVRSAGETFLSLAFTLQEGDVGVAPNQPEDTYYVVLVTNHERASLEEFGRSRASVESQLQRIKMRKLSREWVAELREEASRGKLKAPSGN